MPDQKKDKKNLLSRRKFLIGISFTLGSIPAMLVGIPVISALFNPMRKTKIYAWRKAGSPDDFAIGTTTLVKFPVAAEKPWGEESANTAVWLRRLNKDDWEAFSFHCTHMGCPVRWEEKMEMFMCPCHGGVFYKNGTPAAGPPLRALKKLMVRINGPDVEVRTEPVPITKITGKSLWEN